MAILIKPLSSTQVQNAKPRPGKSFALRDGDGLYLEVSPSGSKIWRMKYKKTDGKDGRLVFGEYPIVSLQEARNKRTKALTLIAKDIDPKTRFGKRKKTNPLSPGMDAHSIEGVAMEWFAVMQNEWSKNHAERTLSRMKRFIFPLKGTKKVSDMKARDFLDILRPIEEKGLLDTVHKVKEICGMFMRYAVITERAAHDPTPALKGALKTPQVKHMPAMTDVRDFAGLLRMIDGYAGSLFVRVGLQLSALFFTRPGELRMARWADFDFERGEWRYFIGKTKIEHIVPLAKQAVSILHELYRYTGRGEYLFPSIRNDKRPMSDGTLMAALRNMGIPQNEMSIHGFRAIARTLMDEELGERVDLIEHQLGHAVKDPLGRAYNRTSFLKERKAMMQRWADYLDHLRGKNHIRQLRLVS